MYVVVTLRFFIVSIQEILHHIYCVSILPLSESKQEHVGFDINWISDHPVIYLCTWICVCVCVYEREREREIG
jgi:hypothetical protein